MAVQIDCEFSDIVFPAYLAFNVCRSSVLLYVFGSVLHDRLVPDVYLMISFKYISDRYTEAPALSIEMTKL